ncbi:RDD family protein [Candidatus Poriferisocius sp.]|uniref:RDD family protein n=1 Tax=Candidatus Poriferisocius sp. TaxID=3101276 RepID=UPI003B02A3D5
MSVSSWEPDPTGRHQYRWWDGEQWTDQVADDGIQSVDPVSTTEASLPRDAPPLPPPPPGSVPGAPISDSGSLPPDPLSMLSSRKRRLGAALLEIPLAVVTLGIGYLIWSLIVFARGQTPAKQVLSMRIVRLEERRTANWGWTALRQLVLVGVVGFVLDFVFPGLSLVWLLVNGIVLLATSRRQALWDMMLKTVVIYDPGDLYKRRHSSQTGTND